MAVDKVDTGMEDPTAGLPALPNDIEVEVLPEGFASDVAEDGSITVTFGEEDGELAAEDVPFDANLAEFLTDEELAELAGDLVADFEADKQSRKDWEEAYVNGLDLLGIKPEQKDKPWPGACSVHHPILAEAVVRFQSQSIGEIFPPAGPCKTKVVGKVTPERIKTANRMREEMNFQLTERMTEFRPEMERMLFALPLSGSTFKKTYFDPTLGRAVSVYVPAEDFVASYGATDLLTCPRYTHVMKRYPNDIRKLQVLGFYRDVELPEPTAEYSDIEEKQAALEGSKPSAQVDDRHTLLEMHVDVDLPGFEDATGIALPYVVTIDKQSQTVLSIYRNWREDDKQRRRRVHFTKYDYIPGLGFYAFGLLHLMGGLARSATAILQQLVDAGTLSNLPGGLKARGLRIKGDDTPIQPGEFRDVDVPGGSIKDNLAFLPYKEPSSVLYQLLGNIVEEGRRIGSVADLQIGDGNQEAPVGTTLALMERAMKVMSAVQARLHASLKQELKLIAAVIHDNLPAQYDYDTDPENAERTQDFDIEAVDIVPVSDPNASSMAQRVVQYQAALQLAQQAPQIYDLPLLHRGMLEVLGIRDADKVVKLAEDQKPMDPVTENMAILTGKPVKAFLTQDHEAHITVHMAAMKDPKLLSIVGQSPQAPMIQQAAMAHIAEHVAFAYRSEMEKQLGVALPPPDEPLPPEVEVELSKLTVEAANRLLQKDTAEQQAKIAAQNAKDPVLLAQQKELEIKEAQVKLQAQIETQRLQLEAKKADDKVAIEMARLQSEERRHGVTTGAQAAAAKDKADIARAQLHSSEHIEGVRMGSQIAEKHHRIGLEKQRHAAERQDRALENQAKSEEKSK